jgi:hypothetical protein
LGSRGSFGLIRASRFFYRVLEFLSLPCTCYNPCRREAGSVVSSSSRALEPRCSFGVAHPAYRLRSCQSPWSYPDRSCWVSWSSLTRFSVALCFVSTTCQDTVDLRPDVQQCLRNLRKESFLPSGPNFISSPSTQSNKD